MIQRSQARSTVWSVALLLHFPRNSFGGSPPFLLGTICGEVIGVPSHRGDQRSLKHRFRNEPGDCEDRLINGLNMHYQSLDRDYPTPFVLFACRDLTT